MTRDHIKRHTAKEYKKRVCHAMDFISHNLDRDLSLDEIAGAATFSMYHFHRIFKAVVGETVAAFTRRLRLEMAANRLMSHRDDDITTIALDCGFSSSQNFATAFRQHFATTPSAFRKSKQGNKVSKEQDDVHLGALYDSDALFIDSQDMERRKTMKAEVREMPDYHVAYARKMGPYGKETSEAAFGELTRWAGPRGHLESGTTLGVYWDNPEVTPPAKCRVDACVTVPAGTNADAPIGTQTISGGPHAVCHFEIATNSFHQAWDDAFTWLVKKGYECDDRPCYELYHQCAEEHPEGKWVFDICIPLKQER